MSVIIETARLRIRCYRDDDLADLVALAGNWEIARWVGTYRTPALKPTGMSGSLASENHATRRPRRFAIALKKTDRLIGGIVIDGTTGDGSGEPALGYWVGQPYWGNGYARKAAAAVIDYGFATLDLETIRGHTVSVSHRIGERRIAASSGECRINGSGVTKPSKSRDAVNASLGRT